MNTTVSEKESIVRHYIRVLFRHKMAVFLTFVVCATGGMIGLMFKTKEFEGQVKILISGGQKIESPYYRDIITSSPNLILAATQSEIVTSRPVMERAVLALGLHKRPWDYERKYASKLKFAVKDFIRDNELLVKIRKLMEEPEKEPGLSKSDRAVQEAINELLENIKVEPVRNTNIIDITATDYSPQQAAAIANVVGRSYCIFDLQQQMAEMMTKYGEKHPSVQQLRDSIWSMAASLTGKRLSDVDAIGPASVKIVEQASVPLKPAGKKKSILMLVVLGAGLVMGIGVAIILDYMNQTFNMPYDVESFLCLPCVGSIPKRRFREKPLLRDHRRESRYGLFYHDLSLMLSILLKEKSVRSLMIASYYPKKGNSTVIANLGHAFSADLGMNTLIVDANLRRPKQHVLLHASAMPGLADLDKGAPARDVVKAGDRLSLLPAGKPTDNPILFCKGPLVATAMTAFAKQFDAVLVDAPDIYTYNDALLLAPSVDGIILVLNDGVENRNAVQNALSPFKKQGINIFGVILNNREFVIPAPFYKMV